MIRFSLISCIILFSQSIFASMYFEPIVGYGNGTANITVESTSTTTTSSKSFIAPAIGFKFGYFVKYVYLVMDARYSLQSLGEATTGSTAPLTNLGVAIGWDWDIPIRTFFGMDTKADTTINGTSAPGTGSRIGLGYYINLETLVSLEFVTSKSTTTIGTSDVSASYSHTMVTFSFPFEFIYPETSWKDKIRQ